MKITRALFVASVFLIACDEKKAPPKPVLQQEGAAPTPAPGGTTPTPAGNTPPAAGATPPAAAATPEAAGREIFNTRCSTCHGASGKGDGIAGAALNPKPRDWTDKVWQKATTDDQIKKVIVEGGQSIGKSPLMVANPDLKDKPEVVTELVKIVRSFGK